MAGHFQTGAPMSGYGQQFGNPMMQQQQPQNPSGFGNPDTSVFQTSQAMGGQNHGFSGPGPSHAGPGFGSGFNIHSEPEKKKERPEDNLFGDFLGIAKEKISDVKQHNQGAVDQYVTAYTEK